MADKLWDKGYNMASEIERFTIGRDREMDLLLARYDVLGSMAHVRMLASVGLLDEVELSPILTELKNIYSACMRGEFTIDEGVEDVHSQVELLLTRRIGPLGKKIHSGRSRNDQVLLDLKLFTRASLRHVVESVATLFDSLIRRSEETRDILMPGYTHLQVAMPSSFGLWFGAYAESLTSDMLFLRAAFAMANRNPLGSAAGYGSSFPLNRQMTTDLLGFDAMDHNVVYAQMTRGKMERNVSWALASVASTLAKLSYDACLFNSQNFAFISLPRECTTGSSIMPHKKNPDVFELIRAKCNLLQALPSQLTLLTNNLPMGYFRDYQMTKEVFLPAFSSLTDCIRMATYIVERISVKKDILDDKKYDPIFSVEEVNRLVREGMPFRDAYRRVAQEIEEGTFVANKTLHHTHEGSMGNLMNADIRREMNKLIEGFHFEKIDHAEQMLLA